jgi:hypothetical protein
MHPPFLCALVRLGAEIDYWKETEPKKQKASPARHQAKEASLPPKNLFSYQFFILVHAQSHVKKNQGRQRPKSKTTS